MNKMKITMKEMKMKAPIEMKVEVEVKHQNIIHISNWSQQLSLTNWQ